MLQVSNSGTVKDLLHVLARVSCLEETLAAQQHRPEDVMLLAKISRSVRTWPWKRRD